MKTDLEYVIQRSLARPSLRGLWLEPAWRDAPVGRVAHFFRQSSRHHPRVEFKLTYTAASLYVFFRVFDRYVVCAHTKFQSAVCTDSCVECFLQPKPGKGYLNFEINCGGTLLVFYIEDATRTNKGFKKFTRLPWSLARAVRIHHSLPRRVAPEIVKPVEWRLEYRIPLRILEACVGSLGDPRGQVWRGNLYKCADHSSHPHWASWAPMGAQLNFHLPQYFAPLRFE
jgi:hypothetical protein